MDTESLCSELRRCFQEKWLGPFWGPTMVDKDDYKAIKRDNVAWKRCTAVLMLLFPGKDLRQTTGEIFRIDFQHQIWASLLWQCQSTTKKISSSSNLSSSSISQTHPGGTSYWRGGLIFVFTRSFGLWLRLNPTSQQWGSSTNAGEDWRTFTRWCGWWSWGGGCCGCLLWGNKYLFNKDMTWHERKWKWNVAK